MGYCIWYSEEGPGRAAAPPRPNFAVPNVTAHPSTASVPITVLLGPDACPLLCGFNVAIKALNVHKQVRTGVVNFAEDGDGVDGGAVPAAIAELLLALVYGDDGARLDGVHHLDVASTDVFLFANESNQIVALVLSSDRPQRSRRRYRPTQTRAQSH